jgi:hypothetical protein
VNEKNVCDAFLDEMRAEFPRFVVIEKAKSPISKVIDVALKVLTFGGQRSFMTQYYTVLGDRLYVPPGWNEVDPVDRVITLRHERIHLRQRRRYTLVGMAFIYLLFPFPIGLAYGRARIEWEAYTETLRATLELKGDEALASQRLRKRVVEQFTSAAYGWMWPFEKTVSSWYDQALERLRAEHSSSK